MQNKKVIALGHNESVYVFNSIGIDGLIVDRKDFISSVEEYINNGINIFIVSQIYHLEVEKLREKYNKSAYPIFLMLAMEDTKSSGIAELRKNVEKATGISLF